MSEEKTLTIADLQKQVDHWIKTYGVRYFHEMTNLGVLMEEVGELSRLMTRTYGEQSFKLGKQPEDVSLMIADEMADIIFVLSCLANQMDINLETAVKRNLDKKTRRDSKRHLDNDKLNKQ